MIASDVRQNGPSGAAQIVASTYPAELIRELQAWRLARETASRCNRNLLQYAAGLAAVLGISAGGGGIMALANSLGAARLQAEDSAASLLSIDAVIGSIVFATIVVGFVLLILLVLSFRQRQDAERQTDEHLGQLITLAPQWFEPRE